MPDTKIATCCYCGRRQAFQLLARGGRELACGACGAPLHEMKWLKVPDPAYPKKRSPRIPAPHPVPLAGSGRGAVRAEDPRNRRPKKRRKPVWKKVLEEVFEVIEDIFD
ncbi:hypothetical protein [Roseicyclus mahoneyensis]|jgi:hypothetical protein|uniref:Uncharacterized protein n=1 Tax=Roseicyclus mahoneyensis TaxID=164332 RepID=A0A316GKN1_9RHOB|nr:hypothetical protein [Roseicyclus mahoneyensis]PWK60548.1 hypothetical protein C7455_104185 [Roseicyclus mahoneyensis]